jgi:hypothetical protein
MRGHPSMLVFVNNQTFKVCLGAVKKVKWKTILVGRHFSVIHKSYYIRVYKRAAVDAKTVGGCCSCCFACCCVG